MVCFWCCCKEPPRFDEYVYQQQIHNEFNFWKAASVFQKSRFGSAYLTKRAARRIYDRYLTEHAPYAIFLDRIVMTKINSHLSSKLITTSLYQEALLEIGQLLDAHLTQYKVKYKIKLDLATALDDGKMPSPR